MKLKLLALAASSVVALAGLSGTSASAQSSGDSGKPPQNKAQCKKFVKGVDGALVWENKRYAKALAKLTKRRDSIARQSDALTQSQADLTSRMAAIDTTLSDEANPPSDEDGARLVDEYNSLIPAHDQNARDLQDFADDLDGLEFEFSELKKTHVSNVRSTVKYRKQVATYCKRFK
jgi:hypothetical protein